MCREALLLQFYFKQKHTHNTVRIIHPLLWHKCSSKQCGMCVCVCVCSLFILIPKGSTFTNVMTHTCAAEQRHLCVCVCSGSYAHSRTHTLHHLVNIVGQDQPLSQPTDNKHNVKLINFWVFSKTQIITTKTMTETFFSTKNILILIPPLEPFFQRQLFNADTNLNI